jgi:hypothetical protein
VKFPAIIYPHSETDWLVAECPEIGTAKGDERKVRLAAPLRAQTTMSWQWIAEHLGMGSWTHVSNLVGATRKRERLNGAN